MPGPGLVTVAVFVIVTVEATEQTGRMVSICLKQAPRGVHIEARERVLDRSGPFYPLILTWASRDRFCGSDRCPCTGFRNGCCVCDRDSIAVARLGIG